VSRAGRYGGRFAHSDIAFEFASWISPEFKLYIIKDYQRLKTAENRTYVNMPVQQLLVLSNMENYNTVLIEQGLTMAIVREYILSTL
jgi:hypothetical protein